MLIVFQKEMEMDTRILEVLKTSDLRNNEYTLLIPCCIAKKLTV